MCPTPAERRGGFKCTSISLLQVILNFTPLPHPHPGAFSTVASRLYAPSLHPGSNLLSFRPVTYRRLRPAPHPTRLAVTRGPLSHSGPPRSCDTRGSASLRGMRMTFNTIYVKSSCSLSRVQERQQWDALKRWVTTLASFIVSGLACFFFLDVQVTKLASYF